MIFEFSPPAIAEEKIKELTSTTKNIFIITVLQNKDIFKSKYYAKQSTIYFEVTLRGVNKLVEWFIIITSLGVLMHLLLGRLLKALLIINSFSDFFLGMKNIYYIK